MSIHFLPVVTSDLKSNTLQIFKGWFEDLILPGFPDLFPTITHTEWCAFWVTLFKKYSTQIILVGSTTHLAAPSPGKVSYAIMRYAQYLRSKKVNIVAKPWVAHIWLYYFLYYFDKTTVATNILSILVPNECIQN